MFKKTLLPFFALALIAGSSVTPAFSQNRFADEARERDQRRAENKAIREAEHPEAAAKPAAAPAAAEPAAPAQAAAPAAPAATASNPTPAPAQ
jgi:hypothetical protein